MHKTECEKGPPHGPVEWYARKLTRLESGERRKGRKYKIGQFQTWYAARNEAMRRFGVDMHGCLVWMVGEEEPPY